MSFERLLKPCSIAVFGGAQAQEVIRQSDRMGYKGEIWPVHPKKTEVLGRTVYRLVEDLPGSPDAAYVGVNRHLTIDIIRDLAARDADGAVCYATGSRPARKVPNSKSDFWRPRVTWPLIGPNCYGLLNYLNGAMLWPDQQRAGVVACIGPTEVCTSLKRFQGGSTGRSERRRGCHPGGRGHGRK